MVSFVALSIAAVFFIVNYILISNGHFNEDAYILFIYVENFINGNGITYYSGASPIEGATDFLWLVLLIGLVKTGLDTGTSVIVLNSIGVFIIGFIIYSTIANSKINNKKLLMLLYPFVFLWMLQQPFIAALGGFSVFLYMALVLVGFVSTLNKKYITYTPYIAIIIALFRPDGVIIGIGLTMVGLCKVYDKPQLRPYLIGMLVGLVVGMSYFVWRYNYFGQLLPLPLYVKSHGAALAGLYPNTSWFVRNILLFGPLIYLAVINEKCKYYLFHSIPVLMLLGTLTFATQSQNIGYRFQAPALIVGYYVFLLLLIEYIESEKYKSLSKSLLIFYMVLMLLLGVKYIWSARKVVEFDYVNQVPILINKHLPDESVIALTEAGKMAYWNQKGGHKIIDLVGLNSVYPAKNTINLKYLESISPDVVMYHHGRTLETEWLRNKKKRYIYLSGEDKKSFINKERDSGEDYSKISKVINSAIVSTEYLNKYFNDYDVFLLDHGEFGLYYHVYAFKKSLNIRNKMHAIFENSFNRDTTMSYYEMLKIRKSDMGPKLAEVKY